MKRQDLDSDSLSEIESLLDEEEDVYEAGVVEDGGIAFAPARDVAGNGDSDNAEPDNGDPDDGEPDDGGSDHGGSHDRAEDEDGDGDDWRKEVEQYLNDSHD
ncbi:MAG: hypothetical protein EDR02_17725 [Actinobacteria bacterium]|nr:MAG: hypothetical protein EDR02_17725 [Actinomycetota bacterium]